MNPKQHGFRFSRSYISQLLEHHNKLLEGLERSNNVDALYFDFRKAFDKVDHGILLNKLKKIGINGKVGVDTQFSIKQTKMCCRQWNNIK